MEQLHRKLYKFVGPFVGLMDTGPYESLEERICIDINGNNVESHNSIPKEYSKDRMLRDLFLWTVLMDMPEMAKVIVVHVQSRICAALVASTIFKQYAKLTDTVHLKEKLRAQALDFEIYAARCIDQCYEYNERMACELLWRQVPLFGYVTCMQVISQTPTFRK
jgi:hypothetical protein